MKRLLALILFSTIIALAAFLRLDRLDRLPPGLHYDEAFNATMAHNVRVGIERPIFFTEDLTEEPMAIYVTALAFAAFGESPYALRLVSAFAGIFTVAALYLLARALFRSQWLALLAAFVLAILYWHINFSRLGMEPIFTPLMLTLALAFLWRALRQLEIASVKEHRLAMTNWILAGVFLGATMYTYKAALFAPILVAGFIGVELVFSPEWRQKRRGLAIFAFVAVLVFAPLGLYFATHPNQFLERPASVAASNSGLATVGENALRVAGMFFVHGDDNPRSNLPGRPALDPFLALGFVAGLVTCIIRIRRSESRFLLLWLGVMIMPSIVTDYAPHFGRSIGVTPAIALIAAYGFGALFLKTQEWNVKSNLRPSAFVGVLIIGGLAFSTFSTLNDYFNVWGTRTGLFDSFDVGYWTLAQKLREQPANEAIYLSPVDKDYYTFRFGLAGRDARSFDGRRVLVLPPPGAVATYGVVTRDDARTLNRLAKIFPNGTAVETVRDYVGNPYATLFRVEGAPRFAPQQIVNARLSDAIELIGYDITRDRSAIGVTVYWGSIAETRTDYTVFVHLLGAMNLTTQTPVWAQDDARPGRGSYPTNRWQANEVIVDEYRLALAPDVPDGEYQIEIGMYNLENGVRARVVNATGAPMENDRVLFERITLP